MIYTIRQMTIADYDDVYRLWEQTEGLYLEEDDSRESVGVYLERNREFCFIACDDNRIIATLMCGHDGRRGILRHLAVKREYRGRGIARALIAKSLSALGKEGIKKCNTFVMYESVEGLRFWQHMGWYDLEDDYRTMQIRI